MKAKHHDENGKILKIGCEKCVNREDHENCDDLKGGGGEDTYSCNECDLVSSFKNQRQRIKHYREKHPDTTIFKCKDCTYGTNYLPNLHSHINSLHEQKLLQCSKCEYSTFWNQSLLAHMRSVHFME